MNENNSKYSLYFKREFVCGKCGSTEFVLGKQPYSRSCEKCGSDEMSLNVRKIFKSFFQKTKQLVSSIFL
jgi:predicted nucleic-acid-binding Zn-ribbon protein